ncbi:MAG: DUF2284 domain-containing protein [Candidatus Accumulibacter sp.]|jgi:predicted metal-binding protein|nr:DUF2284 domain-containing protein [Accumulibacter sp.]
MYRVSHLTAEIRLTDYIRNYRDTERFSNYCKACDRYNACWSCPPFEFDTEEYISPYKVAYIIGTKIVLDESVINQNRGPKKCEKMAHDIMAQVRPGLDEALLKLEKQYPVSKAFFAGMCHICPADVCARIKGWPCIAPERNRPSLESFGFDIGKTSSELLNVELKWSENGVLPDYLTLVSGFFTREAAPVSFACPERPNRT